jgi:hypothetical protein
LNFPEIPAPPIQSSGTKFIHGLIEGIEAAEKQILEKRVTD